MKTIALIIKKKPPHNLLMALLSSADFLSLSRASRSSSLSAFVPESFVRFPLPSLSSYAAALILAVETLTCDEPPNQPSILFFFFFFLHFLPLQHEQHFASVQLQTTTIKKKNSLSGEFKTEYFLLSKSLCDCSLASFASGCSAAANLAAGFIPLCTQNRLRKRKKEKKENQIVLFHVFHIQIADQCNFYSLVIFLQNKYYMSFLASIKKEKKEGTIALLMAG